MSRHNYVMIMSSLSLSLNIISISRVVVMIFINYIERRLLQLLKGLYRIISATFTLMKNCLINLFILVISERHNRDVLLSIGTTIIHLGIS